MTWKPHATVASIIEKDNKFLMVEEISSGETVYNQPAGHLDPDESLFDAVIRETREETAWNFVPEHITGIYLWKQSINNKNLERTFLRVAFCGQCDDYNAEQQLDDGIIRALWMTRDEVAEKKSQLRSPMVIRCIDDYLAGNRYSLDMLINI